MKKLAFLLLLLIPCAAFSAEEGFSIPDLSGGMFSFPSANKIPDNAANLIQNYYSDIEPMAIERNGYIKNESAPNVFTTGYAITGLWKFRDTTAAEWIIAYSSGTRRFYKKTNGNTFSAFGPTLTSNNQPYAATNLGKILFVNGTDSSWTFDGVSTAAISAPITKYVTAWRKRFAVANSTGAQSSVYFSEDGSATNWTLGGNPTDPFAITIGGANDGQVINCITGSYQDSMIVGRDYDTWAASGFDQADIQVRNVSSEIGCIDNATMREFDGSLMFFSKRGVEEMTASTIKLVSDPIKDRTDLVSKNTAGTRYVTDTSQSDWDGGSFSSLVYIDTITASGSIRFTYPDLFSSFRDGTLGTKQVWTKYESGTVTGSVGAAGGFLQFDAAGSQLGRENVYTTIQLEDFKRGTTCHFELNYLTQDPGHLSDFYFTLRPTLASGGGNPDASGALVLNVESTTASRGHVASFLISGQSGAAFTSTDFAIPMTVDVYFSTTTYNLTINGSSALSGTHSATTGPLYAYL